MALKKEPAKYEAGEKVLCFHGPLLYQAKILDVKVEEEEYQYFVHYQGWNKNWDEWVKEERMFKYDAEGLRMQKDVEKIAMSGKKLKVLRKSDLKKQPYPPPEVIEHIGIAMEAASEGPESPKPEEPEAPDTSDSDFQAPAPPVKTEGEPAQLLPPPKVPPNTSGSSSRKRRARSVASITGETEEGFLKRTQIKVELTDRLKAWLVDDWDLTTKQSRLVSLPARIPIARVFDDYLEQSKSQHFNSTTTQSPFTVTQEFRREFVNGLKVNFNFILGSQLLYKFERPQYAELLKSHASLEMVDLYSPMHLLRLLVRLRDLITFIKADPSSVSLLEAVTADFVAFLDKNNEEYFKLEDYISATPDYLRAAMC
ncbi:Mortality factor 4 protein 1 [Echinococcus multilocularis]|uniref:Mortality factor 4 protein 1 n=1 Tax=Echinococcus multilocularis TaxID=6211 RepID=A0A068YIQ5_ECHMU|nr:Mortality factor 4 protein 1 [Echinococcus multilocularis]